MPGEEKTFDLDQVIQEGMQQFTGQEAVMSLPAEGDAGTQGEEDGKDQRTEDGKETGTQGTEGTQGKEKAADQAGKETGDAGAADAKAQERMSELEEENRALKGEKATAEAAAAREKADADFEKSVEEFSQAENRKALAAIDGLDPDSYETPEKYQEQVAKIWAKKETAVAKHVRVVGSRTEVRDQRAEAGKEQRTEDGGQKSEKEQLWAEVGKIAKAEELDPADPDFIVFCRQAPETDPSGKPLDLDAQVKWAINETKEFKRLRKIDQESKGITAEQLAARRQETEQPMVRGASTVPGTGSFGGATEKAQPVSLDDALNFAAQRRTL